MSNTNKPRIDAIFKTLPKLNFKDKEQNQSKPMIEAILKHLQNLISKKKKQNQYNNLSVKRKA
jgi:hypothetical protein